jgi:L-lactate utilization protein LutC
MKKSLIALLVAIVGLGGVMFLNKRGETTRGQLHFVFDTTGYSQMASLSVIKAPDTSNLEFVNNQWVVAKDQWPVDTSRVNKILKQLYQFQDGEVVSRNPERASEYGVDSAAGKQVSWKDKSGKVVAQVIIGKTSGADYNSTYWKYIDKPEVYRTYGNFSWDVYPKDDDWRNKKFFAFAKSEIQFVDVTWKDSMGVSAQYRLEAVNDSTWKMLAPAPSPAKRDMATEIANRLVEMQVDDFLSAKDTNKSKIALDSPMVVAKVELKNGKFFEIKAGKSFDYYAYTIFPGRSDTVKVSNWRFEPFKKKPFELVDLVPATIDSTMAVDSTKAVKPNP